MAPVNLPLSASYTLEDETGSKSQMEVGLVGATTLADARTAATAMIPELLASTDCSVLGYTISATTVETTPAAPAAGSRVERKGLFTFRTSAGKIARVTIPGIKSSLVLSSGRLDDDAPALGTLIGRLQAAPWSDSNGAGLDGVVTAIEVFSKTRKRQMPAQKRPDLGTEVGEG